MALIKTALQLTCPSCHAAYPHGSPYCSRCGAPISNPSTAAGTQSRFTSPHLQLDVPHFADAFLAEGQDPALARSIFERAAEILIAGEVIEYVGVANRSMAHLPDCVVATSKRIMIYKKRAFGKLELGDMFWRDVEGVQMKESRSGVLLIFDSIQGWQIMADGLPKSQAWRLHDLALKYGERLAGKTRTSELISAVPVPFPASPPTGKPAPAAGYAAPSQVRAPAEATHPAGSRGILQASQIPEGPARPTQVAAFHAPRPADSAVVFDPQAAQPVPRVPSAEGLPGSGVAPAAQGQGRVQPLPQNGPPSPAPQASTSVQVPPPMPGSQHVAPGQLGKTTNPLPVTQPGGAGKLGSGPLIARLGQSVLPPQGGQPTVPISSLPGERSTKASDASGRDDPVRKMKQLKEMLDAELITAEDYETKKAEILARM